MPLTYSHMWNVLDAVFIVQYKLLHPYRFFICTSQENCLLRVSGILRQLIDRIDVFWFFLLWSSIYTIFWRTFPELYDKNRFFSEFSIFYYQQWNRSIEKAKGTIRIAIKRKKIVLGGNIDNIIKNYNRGYHRGIWMSHEEEILMKNQGKVNITIKNIIMLAKKKDSFF
jgi:hypothetical protein